MATYMDNYYSVIIDESGNIYQINGYQKGQRIGVDIRKEDDLLAQITEMQEVLDSWRPKMIEAGYIVEPKTPEQIAEEAAAEQLRIVQEQAAQQNLINEKLLEAISGLQSEISLLKKDSAVQKDKSITKTKTDSKVENT